MLLTILIILKTILYINITSIEYNQLIILLFTTLLSMIIISIIEFVKIKDRSKRIGQVIFYSLFSLIIFADVMYYSYFQSLPSVAILSQAKQLTTVTDILLMILSLKNLLMIIDLPFVIYFIIRKQKEKEYTKDIKIKVLGGIVGLFALLNITLIQADKIPALINQELYTYHTMDIINTYFREGSIDENELEGLVMVKEKMEENLNMENKKHEAIGRDKNLIVLQVEALQNFVINLEYNNQEITPNLNKLIKDQASIYFDDYFQLIGRGNTSDAEFVSNNSLHPSMEDFTYSQYPHNTFYGLPWILRDHGYNSWVFHGYEKEFWNRREAYENQGFQRFLSEEDYDFEEVIGFGISDKEFFEQSMDYIKELDSIDDNPFYAFIITLSSHTPYTMDEKYHVLDIEENHKDNIVGDYLQSIYYADQEIGKFIEELKSEGLYEDSVIALYGDHFGITNSMEEVFGPMEDILGEPYNFDHVMNIPLIIHVPGEEINETVSKIGSQIDFYPTILNIMGYENKKGLIMGQDLLNNEDYNFVPTQTILRKGSFIDEDIIFQIARDGIFENSRAVDRKTREELDINLFRDKYDKAISEINIGNFILKEDILEKIGRVGGDVSRIDIVSRSLEVPDQETIDIYEEYTIEDLEKAYGRKNEIIRINIDRRTDLDALESWMLDNENAYLILRSKNQDIELMEKVKDDYQHLKGRYIAEIEDTEDHFLLQRNGYRNIILNIIDGQYTDDEIIDFLILHKHYGVIMEKSRSRTDLPEKLKEIKVKTYIEDLESNQLKIYK